MIIIPLCTLLMINDDYNGDARAYQSLASGRSSEAFSWELWATKRNLVSFRGGFTVPMDHIDVDTFWMSGVKLINLILHFPPKLSTMKPEKDQTEPENVDVQHENLRPDLFIFISQSICLFGLLHFECGRSGPLTWKISFIP